MNIQLRLASFKIFILFFFSLFISSCVSVTLKTNGAGKISTEVEPTPPDAPYKLHGESKYPTWFNKISGHSISLISDCRDDDLTLKQLANEALTAFDETIESKTDSKKIQTKNQNVLDGEILNATGLINSQDSEIKAFLFKKGKCNYTCVLVGKSKNFNTQEKIFENFLVSLRFK